MPTKFPGGWKAVEQDHVKSQFERLSAAISRRSALRRLGESGLMAGAAMAATSPVMAQQMTDDSAATLEVARQAIAAINQVLTTGDASLLDARFSPDYVDHTPRRSVATGQLQPPNLAGLKASLLELRGGVPDAVFLIEDVIASADRFALRLTFRGTLDATALNLQSIGDRVLNVSGVAYGRVADTLVSESWDYDDAAQVYGSVLVQPSGGETQPAQPETGGESRDVRDFQEVELQGIGTLRVTQGDTESLTIEAESRLLRRIETTVSNGRLIIRPSRPIRTREPIVYNLTLRQLTSLDISGAGRAEAAPITSDRIHFGLSGAGTISIAALSATTLDVAVSGNGVCTLAGKVENQTVVLNGASRYEAADLGSNVASVVVQGAAKATVRVGSTLNVQIGGAGQVDYIGDPAITQQIAGVGRLTKVG
jgi:predicted ester cyclase